MNLKAHEFLDGTKVYIYIDIHTHTHTHTNNVVGELRGVRRRSLFNLNLYFTHVCSTYK